MRSGFQYRTGVGRLYSLNNLVELTLEMKGGFLGDSVSLPVDLALWS